MHRQRRLDLLRRAAPRRAARAPRSPRAAASRPGRSSGRDRLALRGEPLGRRQRPGRIAVDDRVRERPGDLLRGVGDHRLEVLAADRAARLGPDREPVELGRQSHGRVADPLAEQSRARRARARSRGAGPPRPAIRGSSDAPSARRRSSTSPPAALDRLGEPLRRPQLRRLLAGDQDERSRPGEASRAPRRRARPASRTSARPRRRAGSGARRSARASGSLRRRASASGPALDPGGGENASSDPGPPSASARARRRASVSSSFASSVPAIRYAGRDPASSQASLEPRWGECIRPPGRCRERLRRSRSAG